MECDNELEQLDTDLLLDQDTYDAFRDHLMGPPGRPLCQEWKDGSFNASIHFLNMWTRVHGFVNCATWTKKLLVSLMTTSRWTPAVHLIRAFGAAFSGSEVGALGRDILEFSLHQSLREARLAALEGLDHWLNDDDSGVWGAILDDHLDREEDVELKAMCQRLVEQRLDWDDKETLLAYLMSEKDGEEEPDPPELEEYLTVGRSKLNRARAQLETKALPSFLERVVDVDTSITLGILESIQVGHLVVENATLGFLMTRVGDGWQVRAWALNGAFSFSIEPTATEDNWLVFTRF